MEIAQIQAELTRLQGISEPWALKQRVLLRLCLQWKPLEDKWFDDHEHWTEDDQYLYLHYYVPCCEWPILFPSAP